MCELVSAIVIGSAIVGTVAEIAGQMSKAEADSQALGYKINESNRNAGLLNASAGDARLRGAAAAMLPLLRGGQAAAEQRVAAGASGLDVSSRQIVNLSASSQAMAEFDSDTILNNAFREAWGLSSKADEYRAQAGQYQLSQDAIEGSTFLGVIGGIASGTSRVASGSLKGGFGGGGASDGLVNLKTPVRY